MEKKIDDRIVTIRVDLWEQQQRERAEYRRYLRDLDPCRLGLYDLVDDDDVGAWSE